MRFEAAVGALPQVVEASHVSGDVDYLLKIVVADMMEWTRLREQFVGGDLIRRYGESARTVVSATGPSVIVRLAAGAGVAVRTAVTNAAESGVLPRNFMPSTAVPMASALSEAGGTISSMSSQLPFSRWP